MHTSRFGRIFTHPRRLSLLLAGRPPRLPSKELPAVSWSYTCYCSGSEGPMIDDCCLLTVDYVQIQIQILILTSCNVTVSCTVNHCRCRDHTSETFRHE